MDSASAAAASAGNTVAGSPVRNDEIAPALAVLLAQGGQRVEHEPNPNVAPVGQHLVVEDEHREDWPRFGGRGEPPVVAHAKVPPVPEQRHGRGSDGPALYLPAPEG
jgi:hypothetical protein